MPDRKKVIKGLEICTTRPCYCRDCPYAKDCALDSQQLMEDALALLKEQPEIVLCKDCKYRSFYIRDGISFAKCELKHNWMPQPDWFCCDGERSVKWE